MRSSSMMSAITVVALILIAVTGFNAVCLALDKLGTPRVFVVQLVFLYRYMFVLVDEAARMVRARSLRTFEGGGSAAVSPPSVLAPSQERRNISSVRSCNS